MGEQAGELTLFVGNRCYMKMFEGHCASLIIDPETRRFVCSVYETRPEICRGLERASTSCHAEIHEKGERPVAALLTLGLRR